MRAGTGGPASEADLEANEGAMARLKVPAGGLDKLVVRVAEGLQAVTAQ